MVLSKSDWQEIKIQSEYMIRSSEISRLSAELMIEKAKKELKKFPKCQTGTILKEEQKNTG